ncbi:energy-coupling factor ABC transporter permease [Clostridium sp. AL.422]|uniref:energy-coupling factor ABC transporter permease n=1 Tax=Clostridium TaxID=1485 RepID=UPI00293DBC89|nr:MULTISPECIES: energy-coupling factor ABC transporter permease [unclassified Clostridium]MDV4151828.1 energy-coupling factor ABC transporter permease [Clostridium sp. AL.422]
MHMADALITPMVGSAMVVVAAGVTAYSVNKIRKEEDIQNKIPLMGVIGAFVFAAQMVNFSIPGTGSSGHIGGGVLLAAILGPEAGFLSLTSILIVQALFFGDGGLLALGCNIINIAFFSCFIGYKLIYKNIISKQYSKKRIMTASILASTIGLQCGAFLVALQTLASGVTKLPFVTFVIFMQPIHLAIGIVEGIVTGLVLNFLYENRPDILEKAEIRKNYKMTKKKIISIIVVAALVVGGGISLLASSHPDGLEWSILKTSGSEELSTSGNIHEKVSEVQSKTSFLPDYGFKGDDLSVTEGVIGTITAGIVGIIITIGIIVMITYLSTRRKKLYASNGNLNEIEDKFKDK